ncbi:MAG: hypothetical protein JJE10_03080 [Thermoleophilia bacterium]|nr:hypothetical protein [Thermoleophilia bacterium]
MADSPGTPEQEIPKGSYAAGRRVRLPQGAGRPIAVFVNGLAQVAGSDYEIEGSEIVFTREIVKEELGTGRKMALLLGLFGTYRKDETIDVEFTRAGRIELAGDLEVRR